MLPCNLLHHFSQQLTRIECQQPVTAHGPEHTDYQSTNSRCNGPVFPVYGRFHIKHPALQHKQAELIGHGGH